MSIYQHFRKEEHAFVDQVLEWKQAVLDQYSPRLSDFLDPRQQTIVKSLVGTDHDVIVQFFGGHTDTERKRAFLYPDYYQVSESDYQLVLFQIHYPSKFVTLEHPQLLGALMNLGVKREKFGDIVQKKDQLQFVAAEEIADFVEMNVSQVGKATVKIERLPLDQILPPTEDWRTSMVTVSSLRLDTVAAEVFRVSRSKMKALIEGEHVKVNWKIVSDPSTQLWSGDMLSVRGKGRAKLIEEEGRTKKDRWKLTMGYPVTK
ncbi:RNA-binding protein [Alteribacter populi]|uniref:YlmH family RNA-binding protein n=1 Tax=Alteribacter populi TaxID=2011011 RepID=UPI000BBB3A4C|nr:RNA-binding protein [Alteribacter populi]